MKKIILKGSEIIYLTKILNVEKLIGLENLVNLYIDNTKKIFEEVKSSLSFKNYITINEKNQVSMDIKLYIILNTCSVPENFISVVKLDNEIGLVKYNYYFYNSVWVKMINKVNTDEFAFLLTMSRDKFKEEINSLNKEQSLLK